MVTARNVTVIPATVNLHTSRPDLQLTRRKVAGYARVSTDSDEQFSSQIAQVDYYTKFINENSEWEFVKVYTDEGISGTNTKHRDGFNKMITDALAGKIELIVTKSVSRFARNTVDSLTTIRKLKEHGIEVYFEKEAIWTFDSKGELLLTIMSSLAQEESRSISENVTWGRRKQFSDGKISMPYGQFLGYRKGADGLPEIVSEEAETVKLIYRLFIEGKAVNFIATHLTNTGIPTPGGKTKWQPNVVESILTNEKYKGAARLQKMFTVDFLTKKKKVNAGEVPQYYVAESHPAIIAPAEWQKVQNEMKLRKSKSKPHICNSPFSCKIICGDCGETYGSKVWHSTDKYRRVVWQCNAKFNGNEKCRTPHLNDGQIKDYFVIALSTLLSNREVLLDDGRRVKNEISDCSIFDVKIAGIKQEKEVVQGLIQKCIDNNALKALDQKKYTDAYNRLIKRYERLSNKQDALEKEREERNIKSEIFSEFLLIITEFEQLDFAFREDRWNAMIDHVTVYADEHLVFTFKNGREIQVDM